MGQAFDAAAFEGEMRGIARAINEALPRFVPVVPDEIAPLRDACEYSLMAGGKRLRPMLVILACETAGGTMAEAMPVACAYECIHTYSLIHDDLPAMDDDDLRRGMPTCHKKFGEATAILAGDALLTVAFGIIGNHVPDATLARDLVIELAGAAGINGMVGGQAADLRFEKEPPTEDRLRFIHRHKTGALLRSSVRAGAKIGGATGTDFDRLSSYGDAVGMAFQVTDDILDVTADSATLGKTAGKDANQQKCTYPAVYGLEKSRDIAAELIESALAAIAPFGKHGEQLAALATYVLHRGH